MVAAAAIALGITVSLWLIQYLETPERSGVAAVESAIIVDRTEAVLLTREQSLLSQIRQTLTAGAAGLTHVYPVVATAEGDTRLATTGEMLQALPLSAPGDFIRNINSITIAGTDPDTVAMVVTFTNFETALAGMYRWEPNLVRDLSGLIGSSPTTRFIDATTDNRDIRVAERGDGTELIYTFIDRNTLLITNDRTLISEVVSRQQQ